MKDGVRRIQLIGFALVLIGLYHIAQIIYNITTQRSFDVDISSLAIIPGIAMLLGSYRAAVTIAHLSAFFASAYIGWVLALLFYIPPGLMWTAIRHYPLMILKGQIGFFLGVAIAIWLYKTITSPSVIASFTPEQGDGAILRQTMRRWSIGETIVFFTLAFTFNAIITFGGTAERAKIEAVKKTGPGYHYYVQKFYNEFRDEGRLRGAYVIAYNSEEMKTIKVTWK